MSWARAVVFMQVLPGTKWLQRARYKDQVAGSGRGSNLI